MGPLFPVELTKQINILTPKCHECSHFRMGHQLYAVPRRTGTWVPAKNSVFEFIHLWLRLIRLLQRLSDGLLPPSRQTSRSIDLRNNVTGWLCRAGRMLNFGFALLRLDLDRRKSCESDFRGSDICSPTITFCVGGGVRSKELGLTVYSPVHRKMTLGCIRG